MLSGKEDKEGQKGQGDARPMDGAVERVRLRFEVFCSDPVNILVNTGSLS